MTDPTENRSAGDPSRRKSPRAVLTAQVTLRRAGAKPYRVQISNMSAHGCMAEFVERPIMGELVWLKFDGLEALEAVVRRVQGFQVVLEFCRPIHEAVFASLISVLRRPSD